MSIENKDQSILDTTLLYAKHEDGSELFVRASVLVPAYLASLYLFIEGFSEGKPEKVIIGGLALLGLHEAGQKVSRVGKELHRLMKQGKHI